MRRRYKISNHKSQINTNDQNSKFQTGFGNWTLDFGIYLGFGA
jgi:hypothetical protein